VSSGLDALRDDRVGSAFLEQASFRDGGGVRDDRISGRPKCLFASGAGNPK